MKTPFRVLLVLVLSFVVLLPTKIASAKETRIEFTGYEECSGDTLIIPVEWYPGRNWQARDAIETCSDTADTQMMTGEDHLYDMAAHSVGVANFILNGKLRMETDEGGVWVGSWKLTPSDYIIKVVAHGEGIYEGMLLHWFLSLDGPFYGYISYNGD
jgi:hypothetical protein